MVEVYLIPDGDPDWEMAVLGWESDNGAKNLFGQKERRGKVFCRDIAKLENNFFVSTRQQLCRDARRLRNQFGSVFNDPDRVNDVRIPQMVFTQPS